MITWLVEVLEMFLVLAVVVSLNCVKSAFIKVASACLVQLAHLARNHILSDDELARQCVKYALVARSHCKRGKVTNFFPFGAFVVANDISIPKCTRSHIALAKTL